MSVTPTFNPKLIGQTEKTLNAILGRELVGTGVTEPQWVALTLTATAGRPVPHDQLVKLVGGALHVNETDAEAILSALADAGLLDAGDVVDLTDAGREFHGRMKAVTAAITERLWGDLPQEDLETAGRVLATVLARATAQLAAS